jgi:RNA polymerase sigma-54 factor
MAIGPRLDLRQSQSLVMTPQLQQAIRLLALSNLELETVLTEEIEKNPLLEEVGEEAGEPGPAEAADTEPPSDDWEDEPETADRLMATGDVEADAPLDVDYDAETFHHDAASVGTASARGDGEGDGPGIEDSIAAETSLHDLLLGQAGEVLSSRDLAIARHLIDQIDDAGYLTDRTLALAQRLGVALADIERVLAVIQSFEPTGVGARDLSECLALQAREADRYDPAMARLIDNLELLARGDLAALRRICGVDQEDLADMIRELRAYDPKPGLAYGTTRIEAITPDVFVRRTREGWAVELNTATLPRLLVNRSYYVELARGQRDKAARAWLSECLASANWLVKALDQRARTIVKVASALVRQQEGFFEHGVDHLRPLTLKAIAEEIGMHESTVSRVTSNKYLACERGLFELKYFFTSAISAADGGEAVSAEAVKTHIRALIAGEGDAILSDDRLVELLREQGFDIARRTVAKYREALGLGSSIQRRRQRAIAAA